MVPPQSITQNRAVVKEENEPRKKGTKQKNKRKKVVVAALQYPSMKKIGKFRLQIRCCILKFFLCIQTICLCFRQGATSTNFKHACKCLDEYENSLRVLSLLEFLTSYCPTLFKHATSDWFLIYVVPSCGLIFTKDGLVWHNVRSNS